MTYRLRCIRARERLILVSLRYTREELLNMALQINLGFGHIYSGSHVEADSYVGFRICVNAVRLGNRTYRVYEKMILEFLF